MGFFKEDLGSVKAFVFDVDGVLASSQIVLHPSGDMMRTMNTKDGFALAQAVKQGFLVAVITGAKSTSIIERFKTLGISDVVIESLKKETDLLAFIKKYDLDLSSLVYMGDDLPDLIAMQMVGIPSCPADAVEEIQNISIYISDYKGGEGCVRDIIEQVMRAQKMWPGPI